MARSTLPISEWISTSLSRLAISGLASSQLVAFASQLAIQSVLPLTTLVEINRLLSNRTVHLDFLGTMADPRVRLKPLEMIREEAARFLLRELMVAGLRE